MRLFSTQLEAAKVSKPDFRPNQRKFRRHFKGVFWNGIMEVRILPGQPGSHSTGNSGTLNLRNARQSWLFVTCGAVSRLPIWTISERNRRKSLANTWNIPVFGRPEPETVRDQHCVGWDAVYLFKGDGPNETADLYSRAGFTRTNPTAIA